jgi:hypothetical protein
MDYDTLFKLGLQKVLKDKENSVAKNKKLLIRFKKFSANVDEYKSSLQEKAELERLYNLTQSE